MRGASPEMSVLPRVVAAVPGCCEGLPGLLNCAQLPPCCLALCSKAPRVDVSLGMEDNTGSLHASREDFVFGGLFPGLQGGHAGLLHAPQPGLNSH